MAEQTLSQTGLRRSAVYSYLRPVIEGRRVLEVGCGSGESAAHLVRLGAKSVIAAGSSREVSAARSQHAQGAVGFVTMAAGSLDVSGVFDLVVVPDAADIVRGRGPVKLAALLALVAPGGSLACVVGNGDSGEGMSYFDLVDALTPHFPRVRMFGQTPFSAYGIAEFDEAAVALRVESELAEGGDEEPTHYIALAGPEDAQPLGYALVQIPMGGWEGAATERTPTGSAHRAPDTVLAELRQKLSEVEGKNDGLVRVSRAQGEEIEELRARLRRTAEARTELDEEVRRLRHALMEADESVVNLTRRTTEEMTALAQRLTAGLRAPDAPTSPALTEELRRRENELAERESALSERDDRIAALETAKQEAAWRADAAEDELERLSAELATARAELVAARDELTAAQAELAAARTELAAARAESDQAAATAPRAEELSASLKAQETTVEEFRRAAAAHLDEVNRLRDAANEQASLVSELEESVRTTEARLEVATAEVSHLRKSLTEAEEADRARRSRLAELEGLMLRAERQAAQHSETKQQDQAELTELRQRLAACTEEAERLRKAETAGADVEKARLADQNELGELRQRLAACTEETERLRKAEAALADAEKARLADENELGELRQRLAACTEETERLRKVEASLVEAQKNHVADQAELAVLRQRLSTSADEAERLRQIEATLAAAQQTQASDQNELSDLHKRLAEAAEEMERLRHAEIALASAQLTQGAAQAEAAELRKHLAETEAEVERLRYAQTALAATQQSQAGDQAELAELRERLSTSTKEIERLRQMETALAATAQKTHAADQSRLRELEGRLREVEERDRRVAELRAEAPDPEEVYERLYDLETQYQAATMAAARVPSLEARVAELEGRLAGH